MKIHTKIRYGLRTIMDIAIHSKGEGVLQKEISRRQQISEKYLDQIITELKSAELIVNAAGKKSGYILHKEIDSISVYDVYKAFQPGLSIIDCLNDNNDECPFNKKCAPREMWCELNELIISFLQSKKLDSIIEKQKEYNEDKGQEMMYYI